MSSKIQQVFAFGFDDYCSSFHPSEVQLRSANSIMLCKSGSLGYNVSRCDECGTISRHNNSCRNRNCPNCQAVLKEVWIDRRRAEIIDAPYFHVVFTVPAELNPLIFANQKVLYSLLHKCASETLLELTADRKYLGAIPGIIQVLHTWGQKLNFHPHIHAIVSGGGLTKDLKFIKSKKKFFIPVKVLGKKFRGKFLDHLQELYISDKLVFSDSCSKHRELYDWNKFRDSLYRKDWIPYIKETFNGYGNAIEYLGRYTHRIAITNSRILSVSESHVTFSYKDYKTNISDTLTITCKEFIRRFMMHVLPSGFQKIRYYGFLNNRSKKKNLAVIFKFQGKQRFRSMLSGLSMPEILKAVWDYDISICPCCGKSSMRPIGRCYSLRN